MITEKLRYVHVGMPKNLSTTLQRDFFSKHPEIMHLGVGINSNVGYINSAISSACENHFLYSKKYSYKREKENIKSTFEEQFEIFNNDLDKKVCGISLELLSFTFTPDQIDIEEKVKRVHEVFGSNTKIILIIREQFSLIESLYREAIKIGYYGTFQEYLNYIYLSRDRNFIFDFNYNYLYELYSKFFGEENIEVLIIENYRDRSGNLLVENNICLLTQALTRALRINSFTGNLGHHNKPINKDNLENVRRLNRLNIHGLGNPVYSTAVNFHRLEDYFKFDLNIEVSDELLYRDVRIKNKNIKEANNIRGGSFTNYEYPTDIRNFLESLFKESNYLLQRKISVNLPLEYL